ncbi:MAG TPA: GNAT family N-acetyltransferase [Symbiobacteriaceae bacterium]|nr:GNAT family N-acetyltransferase [Symbiobacteriaceae bacterium]
MFGLTLEALRVAHATEIIAFEQENRTFFAQFVPDRGDAYFIPANMERFLAEIEAEQARGECFLYLVRSSSGELVGRVNLVEVQGTTASLGYRIGAKHGGQGYATEAVRLALTAAASRGITRVTAMTTSGNVGSQIVLRRNGFAETDGSPKHLDVNGTQQKAIHFERRLG